MRADVPPPLESQGRSTRSTASRSLPKIHTHPPSMLSRGSLRQGSQLYVKRKGQRLGAAKNYQSRLSSKQLDTEGTIWRETVGDTYLFSNTEENFDFHDGEHDNLITNIVKAVGGKYWVAVRKSMNLFPLRFENFKMEHDFCEQLTHQFYKWGSLLQVIVVVWFIFTMIIPAVVFFVDGVLPTTPKKWVVVWSLGMGLILIAQLSVTIPIVKRNMRKKFPAFYYTANFLSLTILFWMDSIFWSSRDKMRFDQFLAAILQDTPLSFIFGLTVAIVINICLPAKSSESFFFNIIILMSFLLSKAMIKAGAEDISSEVGCARGFGLAITFAVTWFGRYIAELQERANTVKMMESHSRVDRIKALLKSKTEEGFSQVGRHQTPAERVVELLDQIAITLRIIKDEGYGDKVNATFEDITQTMDDIIKVLTSHEGLMDLQHQETSNENEQTIINAFANTGRKLEKRVRIGRNEEVTTYGRSSVSASATTEMPTTSEFQMPDIIYRWRPFELVLNDDESRGQVGEDLDWRPESVNSPAGPILEVGMAMIKADLFRLKRHLPETQIGQFLYCIDAMTFHNLYTNANTAARSTHYFVKLSKCAGIVERLTDMEKLTLLMTSLGRYVGYSGFGDKYFQNTSNRLAVLFNDRVVTSSMASALLLKLAQFEGTNLWRHMDDGDKRELRKTVICLLLTLDYKIHFEVLSQFRLRRVSPEFDPASDAEDRWLVARLCFKVSDLHGDFPVWEYHLRCVQKRTLEFFEQGDMERRLGLPVTSLCDRGKFHLTSMWQAGYMTQVAVPFFEELALMDNTGVIS
eukprot:Blabericola_migrator_1__353@NODE_108_length_14046_cov_203_246656_g96_i0_p2_GENE_NODE_108_length_14046_cov_203_246656_g96_i0NODE_108_length_14046_cov_203_246656_g96_i0_p2_ORF_typecomplete_len805_score153_38PDEase_I/PF00233_19/3_1e39Clclike/PF07062_12/1_6e02Clclike/PF07062_12/4_2_NODE_108_length_14046_cov_203_246656_g96_i037566170